MDFKKTYHLHPAMRLLHSAMQRERNVKLTIALCLMSSVAILPYFKEAANNFIIIAVLVAILIGFKMLFTIIRTPRATDERLWHLLNNDTRQIVWVFSITTQTMPFGFHLWDAGTMYFKLADGDEITMNIPVKKLKVVSKFLNRLLPHASFGYSEERQAQFESDPKLLLK